MGDLGSEKLLFWLVNVPKDQWPPECPDFLVDCGEKDRRIIGTPESEFNRLSWPEVKELIRTNRVDLFQRTPTDLRRYRHFIYDLVHSYGSMLNFIRNERLKWKDMAPLGPPFGHPEDIKVLYNDWPYGVDKRIVHLVVWTKFELADDPATDDLTAEDRKAIDDYVKKTFCSRVNPEHVVWFKNWRSLKSVPAIEHFHIMLYDPDLAFVEEITGGDVPLAAKATQL